MNRADILTTASEYVTKDRAATHGSAEDGFAEIGAHWSIECGVQIDAARVARMMVMLKMVRAKANPTWADNWVDSAGYSACGGEIATKGEAGK